MTTTQQLKEITDWLDSCINMQQTSFDEPPDYATQFDMGLAQAVQNLREIISTLSATPAMEQEFIPRHLAEDWKKCVIAAHVCLRKHDSTIPSETLDEMKEMLLDRYAKPTIAKVWSDQDIIDKVSDVMGMHFGISNYLVTWTNHGEEKPVFKQDVIAAVRSLLNGGKQ
jgi:hypothetical protein